MGPQKIDTHPIQQLFISQFTFLSATSLFSLFGEFFQADQGRLTFERLDLLASVHFTE